MLAGDFTPFFAHKHMHKDLDLMVRTASELDVALPVTTAIAAVYDAAMTRGLGELDFSAIVQMLDGFGPRAKPGALIASPSGEGA
jgi:3-hydroxyisobutyrate dehydrogenase-like beta-hydroxyacid dehydrogenase